MFNQCVKQNLWLTLIRKNLSWLSQEVEVDGGPLGTYDIKIEAGRLFLWYIVVKINLNFTHKDHQMQEIRKQKSLARIISCRNNLT